MFTPKAAPGRTSLAGPFLNASISGRRSVQTTPRSTPTAKRAAHVEHVLEETGDHVVTALNTPVPVQVQEALKSSPAECTVRLDKTGWAWLVIGDKLLLWRYCSQQVTAQCVQVSLPAVRNGSGWSCDIITIANQATERNLPVLAVSPEGKAYYWSNVLRDTTSSCEETISLGDATSFFVTSIPHSDGYVMASSVAGLFLIQETNSQLSVREVQLPRGMLSGLSRRVSSLFFGGGAPETQETRRVAWGDEGGQAVLFVLTDTHLQRWRVYNDNIELVYNVELKPIISDSVCLNQWVESDLAANQLSVWLVDVQVASDKVAVLFAMVKDGSSSAEYGLVLFPVHSREEPSPDVDNLVRLNYTTRFNAGSSLLQYCLLGSKQALVMFSRHTALLVNVTKESPGLPDIVNFPQPNSILGAGHAASSVVLFTLHQGVVSISSHTHTGHRPALTTPTVRHSVLTTPRPSPAVRPASVMAPEVSVEATEVLKTAFSEYLEGNLASVEAICEEHFPLPSFSSQLDTVGDLGVVGLSVLIMDDPPVTSDPSWNEGDAPGGKSLILIYRLEQKLLAHNKYLGFLADSGLLDRLTAVTVRGRGLDTRRVLCEHAEKIQAAISVRRSHSVVTDQLIRLALRGRSSSTLTKTDQFYTELSQFESLLATLPQLHKDLLQGLSSPQDRVNLVLTTSTLLLSLLRDAILYRHNNIHMYQVPDTPSDHTLTTPTHEAVYWTSSVETRSVVKEQVNLLLSVGSREANKQDKVKAWSLVVGLSDVLFDGFKGHINSLQADSSRHNEVKREFERDRSRILTSLMDVGQYGHVTELAERYGDFHVLVQLCEGTGDREKLNQYMQKYKDQGFSEFLFKWYLDEGKLQELLSFSDSFPSELASFLAPHPHLRWLHAVSVKDYDQAHKDLKKVADKEVQYVAKKKTLLSLSKLSLLASHGDSEELAELDNELQQINYQQHIPQSTLETAGLDRDLMPPLTTQHIIELYVGGEDERDAAQFITALELIDHTYSDHECAEAVDLRCYVWSKAIIRDDWSQLSIDDPLGELQKTFFSAIIVEGYNCGLDVLSLLPDLPRLLSEPSLVKRGVASDTVFQYMLRAGYEQLQRVQASVSAGLDQDTGQEMDDS